MTEQRSYWVASTERTTYPTLPAGLVVDVVVVGAGIAGLTTARELKRRGRTVAVLDASRVVEGTTGHTTAKVTVSHSLIYRYLVDSFGPERARTYAESQSAALDYIAGSGIECELSRQPNFVYSEDAAQVEELHAEGDAMRELGLPASYVTETPLPFPVAGAVRTDDQLQFHPRQWLLAIAAEVHGDGSYVVEHARATDVDEGDPCVVTTDAGEVRGRDVVVTTHVPFTDHGLFTARAFPTRDNVVAVPVPRGSLTGMYISTEQPTHSVRATPYDDTTDLLVVGGEAFRPGEASDVEERYQRLAEWARSRFGAGEPRYRWSAEDYTTADRVPYVGKLRPLARHLWTATGFGAWGMTNGVMSGLLLADLVTGTDNPWAELYDAQRTDLVRSAKKLVTGNVSSAKHLIGDRLAAPEKRAGDLAPGEGALVVHDGGKAAAYRDADGVLHAVSATCTHLGCVVQFNDGDRCWDCPCHGSRFDVDGRVLHGPAVRDLDPVELDPTDA